MTTRSQAPMRTNIRKVIKINFINIEWKDVVGYKGRYKVSNTGIIKSLDMMVVQWNGCRFSNVLRKGRIRRTTIDKWVTQLENQAHAVANNLKAGKYNKTSFRKRPVICVTNNMIFESVSDCVKWLKKNGYKNASTGAISRACKNGIKAYSYKWERIEEGSTTIENIITYEDVMNK